MDGLMNKWVAMITSLQGWLTVLLAAVAALSLLVLIIMIVITHNSTERMDKIKSAGTILVVCTVASFIGSLVTWAMS